jgi:hypothetical protein
MAVVTPEERFTILQRSAACVQLNREQISELLAITATLFEERRHIRTLLHELPDSFAELRRRLNELARTVR